VGFLDRLTARRSTERQARLARAAADVDRELAANIELASMFDQTQQAVVFENGQFTRHREVLATEVPTVTVALVSVYERMSATEDAMERRGPANTITPEDKALIQTWEGDVRDARQQLRSGVSAPALTFVGRLLARLRGG
jgi:triphosphoribosyl-dephospho-CoA synthetase